MASDCERQFSLAKLTLTSQRLSMGADTLEHVQCGIEKGINQIKQINFELEGCQSNQLRGQS
ncbi:hypothetical protein BKA59DRAFT_484675 [Fusarium tricinctum]|uniref:HAT C-terminal dimerisation domain-containing protein n=1 Tax=Fusarium tricinctum TaxID=61284 RepID=A0A8K0W7N2_9HYPO|nr:hypothetical protein BKA59DRAFT_484675 [Fusarium tricinctum]